MKLITKDQQKEIKTQACGTLTEICFTEKSPSGITVADNIRPTILHYHKKQTELFWVDKGEISVQIKSNGKTTEETIKEGEVLCIEPYESHSITKTSDINRLIIISTPAWTKDDEFVTQN